MATTKKIGGTLHIEAEGCIVNIRENLRDTSGRKVTSVEIIPDQYVGEEWDLIGTYNNRVIKREKGIVASLIR